MALKNIITRIFVFLCLQSVVFSQDSKISQGRLVILVNGFESDDGKAMIAISNSEESYKSQNEAFMGLITIIKNNQTRWLVKNLSFGEYAVKVFHDENENGELDTNFLGIPKEAYGFSNNPPARFGPADWNEAKFNFSSDSLTITIHVD